jgi:photosystem II PsbY protein
MDFDLPDLRLLIVLAPLAAAGGWAIYNVLPSLLKQVQTLMSNKN